jgi:Flp pilus assembly protein CpaB
MRRGGRFLVFLVVIIIILVAVTFLVLSGAGGLFSLGAPEATPTPANVQVFVAAQPINRDDEITQDSIAPIELPQNLVYDWMIKDPNLVIGKFAIFPMKQGMLLSLDLVSDRPGMVAQGSQAARVISPGLVAISIPITRLSSVAYAVRDGDRVNVIATTMLVDLDASFQSILPNNLGELRGPGAAGAEAPLLVAGGTGPQGRIDLDPTLNQPVYVSPFESQRPRLVSQMVLQDIQVLHVGTFSLGDESGVQPTPEPGGQPQATPVPVANPDIITLIVTPQDAVSLTYFLYSNMKLTLTMRAPDDQTRAETESATLNYLLGQYDILPPAKLPYGVQPRIDALVDPILLNDVPPPQ